MSNGTVLPQAGDDASSFSDGALSRVLVDAAGTHHKPASEARIVSLVPSITELLFDLGLDDQVVGRTAFCVRPKGRVRRATSVGGTKTVNLEKLQALSPTHVIVNVDETPRPLAEELARLGYTVVVTHPIAVEDNLALFRLIGALFGRTEQAATLVHRFEEAYAALKAEAGSRPARQVLYLIWKAPWMTVSRDTYISRMLALAKWQTWPERPDARYPVIDLDETAIASVHRVLFSTEPFPFKDRHIEEFRIAFPQHGDKARLIDGQLISWYGSRAIEGLAYLARFLAEEPA